MKNNKIPIGLLYLSLHNLLKRKHGVNNIITRKEFFCELGKHYLVPKNLRPIIIKEMEEIKLIKQQPLGNILILKCEWDLEKDVQEFYQRFNIY